MIITPDIRKQIFNDESEHFGSWELDITQMNQQLKREGLKELNPFTIEICNLLIAMAEEAYQQGLKCEPFSCIVPIKRKVNVNNTQ